MAPQDQADPHGARHRRRRRAGADGNVLVSASPPSTSSIARLRPLLLCALVLATLLQLPRTAAAARADPAAREEEHFIGWKGESYTGNGGGEGAAPSSVVDAVVADAAIAAPIVSSPSVRLNTASNAPSEPAMPRVEVLSWKPRAFLYRNFLNASEARHFQRAAARVLRHSTVVGEQGKSVLRGDYRTSYGCFIRRRSDPVMAEVSRRASAFVGIPELYAEDMQVLRYSKGQQYRAHMDSLRDDKAGPRVATLLLYFNDVPRGGETAFPDSNAWATPEVERRYGQDPLLSECAKGHVAARPRTGDALLFWSIRPDGKTEDRASMHAGCPVEEGVKWTGTIWFHARPFREEWFNATRDPADTADPGDCDDLHAQCAEWAKSGECTRNPTYMKGDDGHLGRCRRACGICEPCGARPAAGAGAAATAGSAASSAAMERYKACRALNRHRAGYLVYDQDFDDPDEGVKAGEAALARAKAEGGGGGGGGEEPPALHAPAPVPGV